MNRYSPHKLIVLIFLIAASIVCGRAYAQKPQYGGTLIFGSLGEPISLDPGVIMDTESAQVANNIFETLVKYDSKNDKFIPCLATSWEISGDEKVYTFHLRKNVKFHDGNPFNAGSVKFSWERQFLSAHAFHDIPYGNFIFYRSLWGGYPGNIKKINIIDQHTIKVELYTRSYRFLKIISRLPFAIISPHAMNQNRNNFHKKPVGTGPFKFVEWRRWHRLVLERNSEYWGRKPYLERLVFEPAPGEKRRRRHLERHRIDIMENPTTDFLYNIHVQKRYPGLKTYTFPGTNFSYVNINCQKQPFNNKFIRKALNHAIDRKRILRDINEKMPVVSSPFEKLWGKYIAGVTYKLDHNQARNYFAKAGYPKGFEVNIWYPLISRPYLVSPERVALGVKQSLEEVGLKVRLRGFKFKTFLEKVRYGHHDIAIFGYTGIDYDPDLYFDICWDRNNAVLGGTNSTFFRNDAINRLLTSCRFEPSKNIRAEKYKAIQKIIADNCPIVPLYHYKTIAVLDRNIYGFSADKRGIIDFSGIWIKQ